MILAMPAPGNFDMLARQVLGPKVSVVCGLSCQVVSGCSELLYKEGGAGSLADMPVATHAMNVPSRPTPVSHVHLNGSTHILPSFAVG